MSDIPDFSENQKKKLEDYYNTPGAPIDLEAKTIAAIKEKGLFRIRNAAGSYFRLAINFFVLVIIFLAGYFIGHKPSTGNNGYKGKHQYMMLLFEPPSFVSNESHSKEYANWFNNLRARHIMATGEELRPQGWTIDPNNAEAGTVSLNKGAGPTGFFTYYASSAEEAFEIASSCPHLKYNGSIELREIQNHEK